MRGSSRGLESGSKKRGGEHHIATGHGPMVQGGLLTAHPGGVHGDGGSPGGGSSFRQGAGAASPGSPDLETAAAAVQRGDWEKNFDIRVSSARAIYRRRGAAKGSIMEPGAPLARPSPGPRHQGAWGPGAMVGPLLPTFGDSGRFLYADFF